MLSVCMCVAHYIQIHSWAQGQMKARGLSQDIRPKNLDLHIGSKPFEREREISQNSLILAFSIQALWNP